MRDSPPNQSVDWSLEIQISRYAPKVSEDLVRNASKVSERKVPAGAAGKIRLSEASSHRSRVPTKERTFTGDVKTEIPEAFGDLERNDLLTHRNTCAWKIFIKKAFMDQS